MLYYIDWLSSSPGMFATKFFELRLGAVNQKSVKNTLLKLSKPYQMITRYFVMVCIHEYNENVNKNWLLFNQV